MRRLAVPGSRPAQSMMVAEPQPGLDRIQHRSAGPSDTAAVAISIGHSSLPGDVPATDLTTSGLLTERVGR